VSIIGVHRTLLGPGEILLEYSPGENFLEYIGSWRNSLVEKFQTWINCVVLYVYTEVSWVLEKFSPKIIPGEILSWNILGPGESLCWNNTPDMDQLRGTMPRGRLQYFRRLVTYLGNQDEDCLNLNLYVPMTHATTGTSIYLSTSAGGQVYTELLVYYRTYLLFIVKY